jgi:hypothetical protein
MSNSGPIKSYKEVVNYFQTIAESHLAVKQFQSGVISDIDVQTNTDSPTRYPLVFLIHRQSFLDKGGKMTLGFSLVVADIAKNQETLEVDTHNETLMIMQDLLSRIILTSWEEVEVYLETPIGITPFVEAYNNNLAGWTAEINLELKSPFDLCNAAFN